MLREQREQRPLIDFGHRRAERIVEIRRQYAGRDRLRFEQARERFDIDAPCRIGGQLECLEPECLDSMQKPEVRRRFDRDSCIQKRTQSASAYRERLTCPLR